MKVVSAAQMRELDRRTIEEFGLKSEFLMERAGEGVAAVVRRTADVAGFVNPTVQLIAGRGNNGGDAFVAARHLKEMGFVVEVWLAGSSDQASPEALHQMNRLDAAGVAVQELPTMEHWEDAMRMPFLSDILVDGVMGIGITGPARGPAVGAIQYIKAQSNEALCVSIDVPSGLNADTGEAEGDAVAADITVTMGLPKRGLLEDCALEYVGSLEVVDLGIPREYILEAAAEAEKELIYVTDLRPLLPRRKRTSHKGNYGHVLLIGGARGYAGAITMAAQAALRSGVGLVSVLVPESIVPIVAGHALESMVFGGRETNVGSLSAAAWTDFHGRLDEFDAILVGPGLTRHAESLEFVRALVHDCTVPLVVDADAISVVEGHPDFFKMPNNVAILTPHPGEMATLLQKDVDYVQKNRTGTAMSVARLTKGVVVLKGAGTVIASEGQPFHINMTGNPGMAKGGAGDVLSGLLAGLVAQRMRPNDAAKLAVYIHGRAGDLAVWRRCQIGVKAGDILEEIPYAFRELTLR